MTQSPYPIFPEAEAFAVEVTTPGGRTLPVGSPELKAELEERTGQALTLRFSERSLYDCRPVSLFGNTTAEALGEELGIGGKCAYGKCWGSRTEASTSLVFNNLFPHNAR